MLYRRTAILIVQLLVWISVGCQGSLLLRGINEIGHNEMASIELAFHFAPLARHLQLCRIACVIAAFPFWQHKHVASDTCAPGQPVMHHGIHFISANAHNGNGITCNCSGSTINEPLLPHPCSAHRNGYANVCSRFSCFSSKPGILLFLCCARNFLCDCHFVRIQIQRDTYTHTHTQKATTAKMLIVKLNANFIYTRKIYAA